MYIWMMVYTLPSYLSTTPEAAHIAGFNMLF